MITARGEDDRTRVLDFWWLLELFSPQQVPKVTRATASPSHRQVIEWRLGAPLPWETLPPPPPLRTTRRAWRHTVYLGVYQLAATYDCLHRVFGEDENAYDERPPGRSACAGLLVDEQGRLIADTPVLSSALWAVGRLNRRATTLPAALHGFSGDLARYREAVEKYVGARRDPSVDAPAPPLDAATLEALTRLSQRSAGVAGDRDLATDLIVIQSQAVAVRRGDEPGDIDFLNSFFLTDLALVRDRVAADDLGAALAEYLTSDRDLDPARRVDVIRDQPEIVDAGVQVDRMSKGRWPARPDHPLALSQQYAVNRVLQDLAPSAGLLGVNGPPGTGKTTMLRDILAGNVVERARRLATLGRPVDAFTSTTHRWTAQDGYGREVRQLRPELTGFEMLLASANNAAVENVTVEIPARDAIGEPWHGTADYFAELATAVLAEGRHRAAEEHDETDTVGAPLGDQAPPQAWGLVAARLGRKAHRAGFRSAFWFDEQPQGPKGAPTRVSAPRMQTRLTRWRDGEETYLDWTEARQRFLKAERRVDELLRCRARAEARLMQLAELTAAETPLQADIVHATSHRLRAEEAAAIAVATAAELDRARALAAAQHDRHMAAKPGGWEAIVTFGGAVRAWRAELAPLEARRRAAEDDHHHAEERAEHERVVAQDAANAVEEAETQLAEARRRLRVLREQCGADVTRYGSAYPFPDRKPDARELHTPWLDPELAAARSELFLAALRLHADFFANAARDMLSGLRAACEVVAGIVPVGLEPEKVAAAWQLFFLVVPLVSTTFASADRMLLGLERESIGWLLVDEGGQAAPQCAAGSIWRARRVVVVGDPQQLQPVVTIPPKAARALAHGSGVSATWLPPMASVQTLADRIAPHGTTFPRGGGGQWVSAPLLAHRRCDDPMFSLCNDLAYGGLMVSGVARRLDDPARPDLFDGPSGPLIAQSYWVDQPVRTGGSHLEPKQIERLRLALAYLGDRGVMPADVIAISPFRAVAERLEELKRSYPGLRAGTIHTAQGREAPVVILVLGGDPAKPGAKAWAASSVNLVNVAASRAQRRLYVIGDRTAWAQHPYFRELSRALS